MKSFKFKIVIILTILMLATTIFANNSFAGMADTDDETSEKIANEMIANQEKKEQESINKSTNNYLASLQVNGMEISPSFDKQTLNYSIEEEISASSVTITATPDDEKATVSGAGKVSLSQGENNIRIDVTAESGTVRTYFIKITTTASEAENEITVENTENLVENTITSTNVAVTNSESASKEENKTGNIVLLIIVALVAILVIYIAVNSKKK